MGRADKQSTNKMERANGNEPEPGRFAGVKRRARYLKRVPAREIKIKNPARYLNSSAAQVR